ncbi:MAG: tRNA lysidine(34) synthetase TilS [Geobacteraceae bacterium]|nr:tRNA lysidine(34) synthetase TilS [Geobacteraceae bacterium]
MYSSTPTRLSSTLNESVATTALSSLATRITGTVHEQQLFSPGDTLIIGLSGGADSSALLDLLADLPGIPLRLVAAHLNHCLRGAESDLDEEFCRSLAERYQIPFESRRIDVKAMAGRSCLNLEDAGRRARVAFFDELRTAWQASAVALAHHADDQAETVLMRLLRGSGMPGLAGISYRNERGYVRPLLNVTRVEIETYLTERGLVWREDGSNTDRSFLRNRIRHELLPLLEQYNPSVRSCLATTASLLSAENKLLDDQAAQAAEQICPESPRGRTCSVKLLSAQPLALQRRVIRLLLSRLHGNLEQFNYQHIEAIVGLAASARPNSQISLPHGVVAVKEYDALVFRTRETTRHHNFDLRISGPGIYPLPCNAQLTVAMSQSPADFDTTSADIAYFDLDRCPFPWHVRTFLPGDRIQPLGMTGRKKLKNLFIDSKIPLSQRSRIPLIFCGAELMWACGLRRSQHACLDSSSARIIRVVFHETV